MKMSEEQMRNSWLFDDNIAKRSLAIFGHYVIGYVIIVGSVLAVVVVIAGTAALFTS